MNSRIHMGLRGSDGSADMSVESCKKGSVQAEHEVIPSRATTSICPTGAGVQPDAECSIGPRCPL